MPDPIEELNTFEPGVPVNPMPAAEVRRRGDRRRRRTNTFAIGGAAAAVILVATPIAVISGDDDGGGNGGGIGPAARPLTTEVLLTPEEVPARDRLTAWSEIPAEGATLACAPAAPATLDGPSVRRDFGADIAGAPAGEAPSSVVRTEVFQFDDAATAREEYDRAQGWIEGCPGGEDLARKGVSTSEVGVVDGRGEWRLHEFYFTPPGCEGGCDAIRFDRMGVAQLGDRVVLMSLAEVGGPLEPEGLDASMDQLFAAAVAKAGGEVDDGGTTIPDGFPLADGLPQEGLEGPARDLELAPYNLEGALTACGLTPEDVPAPADALYAGSRSASAGHLRQLMAFGSEDQAQAFAEGVFAIFANCTEDIDDRQVGKVYRASIESGTGDYAAQSVMRLQVAGEPAAGAQVVQVVRVGSAVLLTTVSDEGTTLDSDVAALELGATYLQASEAVIEAMRDL